MRPIIVSLAATVVGGLLSYLGIELFGNLSIDLTGRVAMYVLTFVIALLSTGMLTSFFTRLFDRSLRSGMEARITQLERQLDELARSGPTA